MSNKIHILSTRPLGDKLIAKAALSNIVINEFSFIQIVETIDKKIEERIKNLLSQEIIAIFTSMNAVNAVGKFIHSQTSWKFFCIGNTTKKLVKKIFGEENIVGTADNADELGEKIIADLSAKNTIFFCGDQRRDELPDKLRNNNIRVEEIIVYKTIETSKNISVEYDGILFFSPIGVKSFFSKNSANPNTRLFAIGSTSATVIKSFVSQPVIVAEKPGKENLVNLAIEYFSKEKII